ncbi:MAG: N-acetyltransferase [Acidimicrobiia bacterium]|nr:N-acetyltransferase [Acidimicrobiia bacterium]
MAPDPGESAVEVRHVAERSRYELIVDGELLGVADYRPLDAGTVVVHHTEVAPALRGRGFSPILVTRMLDDLRARELAVVPTCWYVDEFFGLHPEYADLRR